MHIYDRYVQKRVAGALADTRVVLIAGPRQAGKTTLLRKIGQADRRYLTFDDAATLNAAKQDPIGFIRGFDRVALDEVQRAPEVLLPIKQSVDQDERPGRFLLTGSANVMALPTVADSLAGRMATIDLLPLAQAEIRRSNANFIDRSFSGQPPAAGDAIVGADLMDIVLRGGYPEALRRPNWGRRREWQLDYARSIVLRDVRDIAQVEKLRQMPRLLRILAQHSSQLVNFSALGAPLGISHTAIQKYAGLFEQLYLVRTLPAWSTNRLSRLIKTPKLHFLDSGLLAALRDLSPERLATRRNDYGPLLESFVFAELLKLSGWSDDRLLEFSHFRDKDQDEVDLVIENRDGKVVGIEVKASATVGGSDFRGLRKLAAACGSSFALGLVLCDHDQVVPFGNQLYAAPIASLWS